MPTAISTGHTGVDRHDAGPSRPPARRTYGRQRAVTPDDDEAVASVFTTAATLESPAKSLLSRWNKTSTSWKDSLAGLGSDPGDKSSDTVESVIPPVTRPRLTDFTNRPQGTIRTGDNDMDDDAEDMESVKKEMERMRRQARGEVDPEQGKVIPIVANNRVAPLFGSSSLTDLPTSDPSSPPHAIPQPSGPLAAEHFPLAKHKGLSKVAQLAAQRRAAQSRVESEDEGERTLRRISLPRSSPPLDPAVPPRPFGSHSPKTDQSPSRSGASNQNDNGDDTDDDKLPTLDAMFWADISRDRDEDQHSPLKAQLDTAANARLFDDDSDSEVIHKKGKKIKPLSKKDTKLLQSGLAEGRRSRQIEVTKTRGNEKPMSTWLTQVQRVMIKTKPKDENPGLSFKKDSSPRTSPSQRTPADPITRFTPATGDLVNINTSTSDVMMGGTPSSPTEHVAKLAAKDTRDKEPSDDELQTLDDIFAINSARRAKDERVRLLNERKIAALRSKTTLVSKPDHGGMAEDDEFEIIRETAKPMVKDEPVVKLEGGRRGPDAKAILNRNNNSTSPAISRNKQQFLRQAGKISRSKNNNTVTETFVEFAGKTWKHAELKQTEGGAKPADRKDGRSLVITKEQMERMMLREHDRQTKAIRQKKEEEWNRGARALPPKKLPDFEALVASSNAHRPKEEDSEDEEDDEDFVPDDEDGEADVNGEVEERAVYSGEEDEVGEDEGEDDDVDVDIGDTEGDENGNDSDVGDEITHDTGSHLSDTDKENDHPPTLEDIRKASSITDDGGEKTPRADRQPLADILAPTPTLRSPTPTLQSRSVSITEMHPDGHTSLGDGFGATGEGGFSQLFEETQAGGFGDGLADLRDQGVADLWNAHAMLPGVEISATQVARDNALIAGELEAARASPRVESQAKKRYLNDKGFFTQTRPNDSTLQGIETQMANLRKALAGPSDILSDIVESPGEVIMSSTQKDTSSAAPNTSSPSAAELVRKSPFRRRRISSPGLVAHISPVQKRAQEDTFQRMMRAQRRREKMTEAASAVVKSNWIDNQAEESDEDGGWAPVGGRGSDDEEEGEEDGYIADLVDDQAIDDEEKTRQDGLAAVKQREIELADDAKREAEAKKIIQGEHRVKRKGADFFSDDDDEEEGGGKRRKWSKKERRKRKLEREDGLDKLDGEANVFKQLYEQDLESDVSDVEPEEPLPRNMPPIEETLQPARPMYDILREHARIQREKRPDDELDREIGLGDATTDFRHRPRRSAPIKRNSATVDIIDIDMDKSTEEAVFVEEPEEESQFSITRSIRSSASFNLEDPSTQRRLSTHRTSESYAQYVRDESQVSRRSNGAGGSSVVVKQNSYISGGGASRPSARAPSRQTTTSSSTSGSILMSKGNRFA